MPSVVTSNRSTVALSSHARQRAQQRAIPISMLEALLDHGAHRPGGGGTEIVHFTSAGRQECAAEAEWRCAGKLRSAYAVLGADGTVITVGHRFRRLGRR